MYKTMLDIEERALLSLKISELRLKINGTHLEQCIFKLYKELETAGIALRPKTYLSDDWGCPNKVPAIGIPFYLTDSTLCNLRTQLTGAEVEDDSQVMMLLRHETGHVFNYAYRLYNKPRWRKLFGRFSLPYKKDYKIIPFSDKFVYHLPLWYAQKHPDDDFAETFAVWLTPGSGWLKKYAGTRALEKLLYIGEIATNYGNKPPMVKDGKLDMPIDEMEMTLGEWLGTKETLKSPVLSR